MDLTKMLEKQEKAIDTPELKINDNILSFEDYFIQISNISQVTIAPLPKQTYPPLAFLLFVIGLGFMSMKNPVGILLGLCVASVGGYMLYRVYKYNEERGERLSIQMNSGGIFRFNCKDRRFLNEVMEVLKDCANSQKGSMIIDMKNSVINDSAIAVGTRTSAHTRSKN